MRFQDDNWLLSGGGKGLSFFCPQKWRGLFKVKIMALWENISRKNCVQPVHRWSSLGFIYFLQTIHKHNSIHKLLRVTALSHFRMNSAGIMMISILLVATMSVEIVGTLCCLLALPVLVCKIWWVNSDKQHWADEEMGLKQKNSVRGSVPTIFAWDCT